MESGTGSTHVQAHRAAGGLKPECDAYNSSQCRMNQMPIHGVLIQHPFGLMVDCNRCSAWWDARAPAPRPPPPVGLGCGPYTASAWAVDHRAHRDEPWPSGRGAGKDNEPHGLDITVLC